MAPAPQGTWIDRLGLTPWGQRVLLAVAAAAFLAAPDADQFVRPLLHHRSIVTHSLLPALALLAVVRSLGRAPAAGACLGIAVHLAADTLSPMRGFGLVWWPEPWGGSLGGWSRAWLAGNAMAGAALAFRLMPGPAGAAAVAAVAAGTAVLYGWLNEGSLAAILVSGALLGAGWAAQRALPGRR